MYVAEGMYVVNRVPLLWIGMNLFIDLLPLPTPFSEEIRGTFYPLKFHIDYCIPRPYISSLSGDNYFRAI